MIINQLRTNHLTNPCGYEIETPVFSWVVAESTGKKQECAQIRISKDVAFENIVYDTGKTENINSLAYKAETALEPRTKYYWDVTVWADDGNSGKSEPAYFETAKMREPWQAKWLTSPFEKEIHPLFRKEVNINKKISSARAYIIGLGLYELQINNCKGGDEYLAPFCNDYDKWLQYQTYDITSLLRNGDNAIDVMLGNGWYKGRFGFINELDKLYGDSFLLFAEIKITYEGGVTETIATGEDWLCAKSPVLSSGIYDGEVYDANVEAVEWRKAVEAAAPKSTLKARLSPPVTISERRKPIKLLRTPVGEDVLDFGQIMTGWVEFTCNIPKGEEVLLQFGELLQNDNFYTENLRTAKQEFRFISNGHARAVRPHFTFYGFRFVKISGIDKIDPDDFTACAIHSDLDLIGEIETSNEKVNKLISNVKWGQRGNFLDVPTDCPQRDERMGWTGDAQVFAATASFNMYTPAFFKKYLFDMLEEQKQLDGSVPHVVPDVLAQISRTGVAFENGEQHGSCAWGDAATIIPWTMYQFYGDKYLLAAGYENMKLWADYICKQDEDHCGGSRLWSCGFHFADWLALDNPDTTSRYGRTDPYFVASCYYYYSTALTAKAAKTLDLFEDCQKYEARAEEIKAAIQKEYFTPTGRLAIDTQTALVLALYFDVAPSAHRQRLISDLKNTLEACGNHLNTGFVGTAYLCPALSKNGLAEYAYTLLLNEDYPSWLYEVNMGATTVWERWNSVLPNGLVSDTGMNSMNHYAYGAIMEWMYRYMCGINPDTDTPGFKKAVISPMPDTRLSFANASYMSASGCFVSKWEKIENGIRFNIEIPFDATAEFILPQQYSKVSLNGKPSDSLSGIGKVILDCGAYEIVAINMEE